MKCLHFTLKGNDVKPFPSAPKRAKDGPPNDVEINSIIATPM